MINRLVKKILFPLFLFSFGHTSICAQETPVQKFLNQQENIRILATEGIGMGDLAASANVMQQLRNFGYQGHFDFIYDYDGEPKNVSLLFGLPSPLPVVYEDKKNKIRFIKIEEYFRQRINHKPEDHQQIAFTGFYGLNACSRIEDEFAKEKKETILCKNEANFTDTNIFINISNWPTPSIKDDLTGSYIFKFDQPAPALFDSRKTYFATPVATLKNANTFLETNPQGIELIKKKPALRTLIDGIQNHQFDFMALYGWGVRDQEWRTDFTDYAGNLLQIISAVHYTKPQRPLVIGVFYNYEKELNELNNIILHDQWEEKFKKEPGYEIARTEIKKLKLAEVFSAANLADTSTVETLSKLKTPGQIVLLNVGSLPKTVFDGLYTHVDSNIWPQSREGSSSFSSLLLTGRPHFRCSAGAYIGSDDGYIWEMSFNKIIKDPVLKQQLETLYTPDSIYCSGFGGWQKNSHGYQLLATLMQEATKPTSSFSSYFAELKREAEDLDNNRVYQSIIEVLKY